MALAGWSPAQQETYLRGQFHAQQEHYFSEFPQGEHSIIQIDDRPIGRLLISRNLEAIDLVDISLLPRPRAAGIGTRLIESLLNEGNQAGKPVRLYVFRFDGASRLCERLGFRRLGESPPRLPMEAALSRS
jgi:GNAT superfamily N-acetyltransferase